MRFLTLVTEKNGLSNVGLEFAQREKIDKVFSGDKLASIQALNVDKKTPLGHQS